MQSVTAVSDLKIRAGIGRVGNQDIGDFPTRALQGQLWNYRHWFPGKLA